MLSIKDRLQELRAAHSEYDPTKRYTLVGNMNTNIVEILQKVEEIKIQLYKVIECTRLIKKLCGEVTIYSSSTEEELDLYMNTANENIKKAFFGLQDIECEIELGEEICNAETRIKYIQYTTLKQLYNETTLEYYNFLEKFKESQAALLLKQIKIKNDMKVTGDLSELPEEKKINVFTDNLIGETNKAKQMLSDLQIRHNNLIKIENNLKDLQEIFLQFATTVYNQKELVNRVEYHALNATEYVEMGTKQLEAATNTAKKSRKIKIKLLFVFTALLLITILFFYFTYK